MPGSENDKTNKAATIWLIVYFVLGLLMYISYYAILGVKKYPGKDKDLSFNKSWLVIIFVIVSMVLFGASFAAIIFGQATVGTILLLLSIIVDFIVGTIVGTAIENADGTISTDAALGYATTAPYIIKVCLLVVSVALAASGSEKDKVGAKLKSSLYRPELIRGEE